MPEPLVLALDLGGTYAKLLAYGRRCGVLVRTRVPSRVDQGPARTLKRLAAELKRVRALSGAPAGRFVALGIGAPGPLDRRRGLILKTPNLEGWRAVPIAGSLGRALGLPTVLDNDARCAALAEHRLGAGQGSRDLALLTLGTGVGGGLILDGHLRHGPDFTAGEMGFLYLDRDPRAPRCRFGLPGSLEALAAAPALALRARAGVRRSRRGPLWRLCQGRPETITAEMARQALDLGDPHARAAWEQAGQAVGLAAASLINLLNLDHLILGGGVMADGGRALLERARAVAKAGSYPQAYRRCRMVAARLGEDAGALGAAELALDRGRP